MVGVPMVQTQVLTVNKLEYLSYPVVQHHNTNIEIILQNCIQKKNSPHDHLGTATTSKLSPSFRGPRTMRVKPHACHYCEEGSRYFSIGFDTCVKKSSACTLVVSNGISSMPYHSHLTVWLPQALPQQQSQFCLRHQQFHPWVQSLFPE